jgi:hypothetical protein
MNTKTIRALAKIALAGGFSKEEAYMKLFYLAPPDTLNPILDEIFDGHTQEEAIVELLEKPMVAGFDSNDEDYANMVIDSMGNNSKEAN